MVEDGSLSFGPFASYEQCVRRISKAALATSDLKEFTP